MPWKEGYQAFKVGNEKDANPYEEDSNDAQEWLAGFFFAADEDYRAVFGGLTARQASACRCNPIM